MATFVLVPGTGSTPDDWSELIADLEDRGEHCLLVDLSADRDQPGLCADRIAWAASRSRTSPMLVVQGDAAEYVPEAQRRFHFAEVVRLSEDGPGPDRVRELAAHLTRQARKAVVGVRGLAPERGLGAAPPV